MDYLNPEFLKLFAPQVDPSLTSSPPELSLSPFTTKEEGQQAHPVHQDQSTEIPQSELKKKILSCENLTELIETVKPYFQNQEESSVLHPSVLELFKKRSDISSYNINSKGKLELDKKRWKEAVKYYNRAIAYANTSREEGGQDNNHHRNNADLSIAMYKRSLILNELKDPTGALKELERALHLQKSSFKKFKLGRGVKLFQDKLMEQIESQKKEMMLNNNKIEEEKRRREFCDNLFKLKSPNVNAPALEDFVQIKFSPTRGRYLIVTKDIPMGTTVLVEKPFVTILEGTLNLDTACCHFCLKRNLHCIPCPNCVFALFCDEDCMTAAHSYHQFECPCLPEVNLVLKDYCEYRQAFYLAFKLMCVIGPSEILKLFHARNKIVHMLPDKNQNLLTIGENQSTDNNITSENKIPGLDPETKYESDSYFSILNLISDFNPEQIDPQLPIIALQLVAVLDRQTNFFSSLSTIPEADVSSKLKDFVAELIFHHFQCFCRNVYGLCQMDGLYGLSVDDPIPSTGGKGKKDDQDSEYFYYGRAAFATASLINHSCVANTTRFTSHAHGLTAYVSLQSIKKGEELVVSYIPSFWKSRFSASRRRRDLQHVYEFLCDCPACSHDWPTMTELEMAKKEFICSTCSIPSLTVESNNIINNDLTQLLNNNNNNSVEDFDECQCRKWSDSEVTAQLIEIDEEFSRQEKAVQVARQLVQSNFPLEAITILKPAIEFFQKNIRPPSHHLYVAQSIFDKAVELAIFFSK